MDKRFDDRSDMTLREIGIAKALLKEGRGDPVNWGYDVKKRVEANKFLFTCAMDYQMDSEIVWRNANRFIHEVLGDPKDLWRAVRRRSEATWFELCRKESLHRFPQTYTRLWRIAGDIVERYSGDARRIWNSAGGPADVVRALEDIKFGEQLSRMTAGALKDQGQITGCSLVKADLHIRRVIGRIMDGEPVSAERATELTLMLHRRDPWQLDRGLFQIGKTWCKATPECEGCPLQQSCRFAKAAGKTRAA